MPSPAPHSEASAATEASAAKTATEVNAADASAATSRPLGLVLGSGLDPVLEAVTIQQRWSYADLPDIPPGGVPGHAGELVAGELFGQPVLIARGRRHLYEGIDGPGVAALVRELHRRGVRQLVLTNAAGSLRADWRVGDWMVLDDQLNLTGTSPLVGPDFVDCSQLYSAALRQDFQSAAASAHLPLRHGVYAGLRGPQYETPAEIRMLRTLGADAVGMSTVLEAIQARALGLEVLGLSCLTNLAAGLAPDLSHAEVLQVGRQASADLLRVLTTWLKSLRGERSTTTR